MTGTVVSILRIGDRAAGRPSRRRWAFCLPLLAAGVAVLIWGGALAGLSAARVDGTRLTVTVHDRSSTGPRVAGALVCLDTIGRLTDASGQAVFDDVPVGNRRVSVWKSGFQRADTSLLINDYTGPAVARVVLLQPGTGTAACQMPVSVPSAPTPASDGGTTYERVTSPSQTVRPAPVRREYTVTGEEALAEGRRQGFRFTCTPCGNDPALWIVSDLGRLELWYPGFFLNPLDPTTTYDLFAGRSLKPGWEFVTMAVKTDECGGCKARYLTSPGGSSLAIRLAITFPEASRRYFITSFKLRGPDGARWQDAFAR